MHGEHFFLVLPSNSSMKYFPDNTTTSFTTQIPREINLHGVWGVGLSEIHIPCTVTHLQPDDCLIIWDYCDEHKQNTAKSLNYYKIPRGIYTSHKEIISEINNKPGIKNAGVEFTESTPARGYIAINARSIPGLTAKKHTLQISSKLERILGFETPTTASTTEPPSIHIQQGTQAIASRPASINRALPDQLFVYTDICVPYPVGDVQTSLLRIVNLDTTHYTYGATQVKYFSPPNYIPLLNNRFHTIMIDIRDQFGKPIAFEYGTLTLTLHFKRLA